MLLVKDREEHVNVTFDFSALIASLGLGDANTSYASEDYFAEDYAVTGEVTTLTSPVVEIARDFGDDQLVAGGSPSLSGLKVTQQLNGGTPGAVYDVACLVTLAANGEQRRLAATVAVV